MTSGERLIVFLKAPRPGEVKTRLAATLGAEGACEAYRVLVDRLMEGLSELPAVELRHTPDAAGAEVECWRRPGWTLAPQRDGDLGARLIRAFAESFAGGANRVVIIGSDAPAVRAGDICEAWARLASHDVVIGPATDGGYWLIGLRRPTPELFQQIQWSTPEVLPTTLRRAEELGLRVRLLRELSDVDDADGWQRFLDRESKGRPAR